MRIGLKTTLVATLGIGLFAPAAAAQTANTYVGNPPPVVAGVLIDRSVAGIATETATETVRPRVAGTVTARAGGDGGLPVTGGDIAGLVVLGLGTLGAGSVLVRRSRVRQA